MSGNQWWCHTCRKQYTPTTGISCPTCGGEFVEELHPEMQEENNSLENFYVPDENTTSAANPGSAVNGSVYPPGSLNSPINGSVYPPAFVVNRSVYPPGSPNNPINGSGHPPASLNRSNNGSGHPPGSVNQSNFSHSSFNQAITHAMQQAMSQAMQNQNSPNFFNPFVRPQNIGNTPVFFGNHFPVMPTVPINNILNFFWNGFGEPLNGGNFHGNAGDYAFGNGNFEEVINHLFQQYEKKGPPPASKEFVQNLKTVKIKKDFVEHHQECTVCKCEYEEDQECITLPCDHNFHGGCIKTWLQLHNTCPICRWELPTDDKDYEKLRQARQCARNRNPSTTTTTTTTTNGNSPNNNGDGNSTNNVNNSA